jgi:hypothetical protein
VIVLVGIGAAAVPVVLAALYKIFQRKQHWSKSNSVNNGVSAAWFDFLK